MFKFGRTQNEFYDSFERAAGLIVKAAQLLSQYLEAPESYPQHAEEIRRLEHEVDDIVHQTMGRLHQSFLTPLDRGDIRRLIGGLDDVIDSANAAVTRMRLYELVTVLPEAKSMAAVLVEATQAVVAAVGELRHLRQRHEVMEHCIRINRLEDEGDAVYRKALVALFGSGADPLMVIKWKEVLEYIEDATDRCEAVADIVEGIVMENA